MPNKSDITIEDIRRWKDELEKENISHKRELKIITFNYTFYNEFQRLLREWANEKNRTP